MGLCNGHIGRIKLALLPGPAGWISPAEMRTNPPFVFKGTSLLHVPSMPRLGSTVRAGVPTGYHRVGKGGSKQNLLRQRAQLQTVSH